jgi:mRNA interferase RelE/StbE
MPSSVELRMRSAIKRLATNPRPNGTVKLSNEPSYRIRVGNYRIIYDIDDRGRVVVINAALHRKDSYK